MPQPEMPWIWGAALLLLGGCSQSSHPRQQPSQDAGGSKSKGDALMPTEIPPMASSMFGAAPTSSEFPQMAQAYVVHSKVPPVPIDGGTLLVTHDGLIAVAADPDRERVVIVDLMAQQVRATVLLEPGDEPGRLVEDGQRRAHVVLRRAGDLASIDLESATIVARRHVCRAPQGVAYDSAHDALVVACSEGKLVTLPAAGGEITRSVDVDTDLRDVVFRDGQLLVTRFKSAELLALDDQGAVISRVRAATIEMPATTSDVTTSDKTKKTFEPGVAWRTVVAPDGTLVMLHQHGQTSSIVLQDDDSDAGAPLRPMQPSRPAGCFGMQCGPVMPVSAAYGAGGIGCDAIVQSGLTAIRADTAIAGPMLAATTLAVDAAVSPDGQWLAIAAPGVSPRPGGGELGVNVTPGAIVLPTGVDLGACVVPGYSSTGATINAGQVIAVAFDSNGRLLLQTRDPNRIRIPARYTDCNPCSAFTVDIDLGGEPRRDTGHDMFHIDAGAGVACASCHPHGGEDGHTWVFSSVGPRRTLPLEMGFRDTLPLDWSGDFDTFFDLLEEVYVKRMGGAEPSFEAARAVDAWLASLHAMPGVRTASDPAALRGKALFEDATIGCNGCHSRSKFTDDRNEDVGTGGAFQVPSLVGVAYHQPLMHDGCAVTLDAIFDSSCGGAHHGATAALTAEQRDDLAAYLESL